MFDNVFGLNDITELPLIDSMVREMAREDEQEQEIDISELRIPAQSRGFVLYPSHLKSYVMLKREDSNLAMLFIEDLMSYGITGSHITQNMVVRALMENIAPVLDSQHAKYAEYCARDKHKLDYYNHPEDRVHASCVEEIRNAMNGVEI